MEQLTNCPICTHQKFKPFLSCTDYTVSRETFHIVECENCGFHFTNPRPTEAEIGKYYQSEEYVSHSGTKSGFVNKAYHLVRKFTLAKKLQLIVNTSGCRNRECLNSTRILDYGCGTGEFLNSCKKTGLQTTGIEPEKRARDFGNTHYGLNILPPDEIHNFPNESFDIITLWHVLEHIHRLNDFLIELKRMLKGRGVAIIAVPNLTSLDARIYGSHWAAYDLPRHLYHFSPNDIKVLFKKQGFEIENVKPMVFDAFYVSMLSEKYKNMDKGKNGGNILSALITGLKSNLFVSNPNSTCSSQIYILRKISNI